MEAFLAQVLQRRRNHSTFELEQIEAIEQPEVHERFGIDTLPTLVVVAEGQILGRMVDPDGCKTIEQFLAPWLR